MTTATRTWTHAEIDVEEARLSATYLDAAYDAERDVFIGGRFARCCDSCGRPDLELDAGTCNGCATLRHAVLP
jgi:hypothetical protein